VTDAVIVIDVRGVLVVAADALGETVELTERTAVRDTVELTVLVAEFVVRGLDVPSTVVVTVAEALSVPPAARAAFADALAEPEPLREAVVRGDALATELWVSVRVAVSEGVAVSVFAPDGDVIDEGDAERVVVGVAVALTEGVPLRVGAPVRLPLDEPLAVSVARPDAGADALAATDIEA
jgi:hypothetical protein